MNEAACPEKPEAKDAEEHRHKRPLILLSIVLGVTIVAGGLLYLLFGGVPLGSTIPFLKVYSFADVIFLISVIASAAYIGVMGLKELFVERRFSVEFLMAVA